eukprot:54016_1
MITQSSSQLIVKSTDLDIDVVIDIEYKHSAIDTCEIVSPSTGTTDPCGDGIPFNRFRRSMIGSTYQIVIQSRDTYLTQYIIPISIENCDIGSGLIIVSRNAGVNIPCTQCAVNSINIYQNSECADCNDVDGIQCSGLQVRRIYRLHLIIGSRLTHKRMNLRPVIVHLATVVYRKQVVCMIFPAMVMDYAAIIAMFPFLCAVDVMMALSKYLEVRIVWFVRTIITNIYYCPSLWRYYM